MARPKVVENWKVVLLRSWAVWFGVISAIAGVIELNHSQLALLFPLIEPYLTDKQAGTVAAVLAGMVPVARILKQTSLAVSAVVEQVMRAEGHSDQPEKRSKDETH